MNDDMIVDVIYNLLVAASAVTSYAIVVALILAS